MRLLGQTTNGLYVDDGDNIHPDELHRFYGTTPGSPTRRRQHQTGAGHPPEEEESDDDDGAGTLVDHIADSQQAHIRHDGVPVPIQSSPFGEALSEAEFLAVLGEAEVEEDLPEGLGVLEEEQEYGYDDHEVLRSGRRGRKELLIELPEHVWRPRAELWARGLHLMSRVMYALNDE